MNNFERERTSFSCLLLIESCLFGQVYGRSCSCNLSYSRYLISNFCVKVFLGLMFPILSFAFLLVPDSRLGQLMRNPTVKFFSWLLSEAIFILMLLLNTVLAQGVAEYGTGKQVNNARIFITVSKTV